MPSRPKVVAFDVIDTVFALHALRAPLDRTQLDGRDVEALYAAMLRDAMALTLAGGFAPLPDILGSALDQLRSKRGLDPDPDARQVLAAAMKELDPHPDAAEAFQLLKSAGVAVHALSNGAAEATRCLLERAGMTDLFDGIHSAETVGRYKPHRDVYLRAASAIGVAPDDIMLVATHAWDCHGAKRAGLKAGFVQRGQNWPPAFDQPDAMGEELLDVARAIVG